MKKKLIALLLLFTLIFTLAACGKKEVEEETETEPVVEENVSLEISVAEFNKRGNVILDTTFDALKEVDIEPADIITVKIGDTSYDMPVGTSYSDVDSDCMLCRFDTEDAKVVLAINGGSFAETANMAVKETIEEDPGYKWNVNVDKVTFTLKEKAGYKDEYTVRNLERTNERADYSNLSDADFANCRVISTTGVKENVLYRGTTPLDSDMARDTYAMSFITDNGIKSILNLADSVDEMTAFETYEGSYYASCKIWNAEMGYSFASEEFAAKVCDCVKFINENDGPFYIHCKEGKDRTGVLCAVLECYCGASYEEVKDDYILTYINFYHVEEGSETYNTIIKTNLDKILCNMFGVSSIENANLKAEAEEYLLSTGLTSEDLDALNAKIYDGSSDK